jgi:glycosyltransferase involved in cell wall biosynthesis
MTNANNHILLICIEFVQPLFSGNGILTQGLVRGLLAQSQQYHITVFCARPESKKNDPIEIMTTNIDNNASTRTRTHESGINDDPYSTARMDGRLNVLVCNVPDDTWRRLDRSSCWKIIAQQAPSLLQPFAVKNGIQFDFIFAIDWSALPAVYNLQEAQFFPASAKMIYFVFRVFSASKELCHSHNDDQFYRTNEVLGMEKADLTILLSHVDEKALANEVTCSEQIKNTHILVPPLRHDIHCQARIRSTCTSTGTINYQLDNPANDSKPQYILCNARLSPEKNALKFAQIMHKLHENKILTRLNLTPLLIGAICDEEYAKQVCALLPSQSIIVNRFMASHEMSQYLRQTILNVHPSIYDAYGMTVVEAAAFGVPSIIHKECIGASSLLREEFGEIIFGDMDSEAEVSYKYVESALFLTGRQKLQQVGRNARERALSWSVNDYADELHEKLALCSTAV